MLKGLDIPGEILGTVKDAATQEAIEGARIEVCSTTSGVVRICHCTENGEFGAANLDEGEYRIEVSAEDYNNGVEYVYVADEQANVAILLTPTTAPLGDILGVLLDDSTDEPIAGAEVTATPVGGGASMHETTDATGSFMCEDLLYGDYTVLAEASGYKREDKTVILNAAEVSVELRLKPKNPPSLFR